MADRGGKIFNRDVRIINGALYVNEIEVISSDGVIKGDIQESLAQGSIYIGNASGVTSELSVKGDGKILVGNGTTATSVAVSGDGSLANNGTLTLGDGVVAANAELEGLADGEFIIGVDGTSANNSKVTMSGDVALANDGTATIQPATVTATKAADSAGVSGGFVAKSALALYDFATDGGAQGAIALTSALNLPDNAVVWIEAIEVVTTFTSATDAATVTIGVPTDGNLCTAIAISDASNPWDAGIFVQGQGAIVAASQSPVKLTAARDVQLTVAGGEDLTAGKAIFRLGYYVSE